ncbi:MAG: hypothetical protein R2688_03700 [Fimbriimonadaceae bacterium]
MTRGRAENSGENSVQWTLRDNANRAVAPGTYRVEILAETPNGERVRKLVPVSISSLNERAGWYNHGRRTFRGSPTVFSL